MVARKKEYQEGPKARATFENAMKTLFKAKKQAIKKPSKRGPVALRKSGLAKP